MEQPLFWEKVIISQYIKLQLEKKIQQNKGSILVRFPLQIFQYCQTIFKKEHQIGEYLLSFIPNTMYYTQIDPNPTFNDDQVTQLYLGVIKSAKLSVMCLSQLFLRCFLCGLSVRFNLPVGKLLKNKFAFFAKRLQLQLMLEGDQMISDVIIKELEILGNQFDLVEFYEQLKNIFIKCELEKVIEWINGKMTKNRRQSEKKYESVIPYRVEQKMEIETQKNHKQNINMNHTNRISVSQENYNSNKGRTHIIRKDPSPKHKEKSHTVQQERKEKNNISLIKQANRRRKSQGGNTLRYSCKYGFKSARKREDIDFWEEDEESIRKKQIKKQNYNYPTNIQCHFSVPQPLLEDEDSKILCRETPPRRNHKQI